MSEILPKFLFCYVDLNIRWCWLGFDIYSQTLALLWWIFHDFQNMYSSVCMDGILPNFVQSYIRCLWKTMLIWYWLSSQNREMLSYASCNKHKLNTKREFNMNVIPNRGRSVAVLFLLIDHCNSTLNSSKCTIFL